MNGIDRSDLRDLARTQQPPNPGCSIRASNDIEALERWLDEYFDKPTTFRSYKKEGERFLVWCVRVRRLTLSQLKRDDIEAYIQFLHDPQPRELWCGTRRKKNHDEGWRPFAGPLSGSAIRTALASLNSFMSYLLDARYLAHNPFSLIRRKHRFKPSFDENAIQVHERILSDEEWQAILTTIAANNDPREHFIVRALYFLGLRIDELARARWGDCKKLNGKWWLFVRGKRDRLGKIPINSELLHAIMTFRHRENIPPLPEAGETAPLFKSPRGEAGLSARQLSNIIKGIAQRAAVQFPAGSLSHEKLQRVSPHWLRHLSASRQDRAGIAFTNIKSNLRHENDQTTRIYVHAHDDDRHRDMEKLHISP